MLSYIFDYAIVILLILGFSALDLAEPHHQRFSLNNESLQYPYADPERISPLWAGVISCLFPIVCIVLWSMVIDGMYSHHKPPANRSRLLSGPWQMSDRLWEMNCGILGLGLSVAGTICVTGALKNATGKPRPDIIARCNPREGATNAAVWGLVTSEICTQTDHHILRDGFKSWPSGHASTAFAGLGFLSLFLAGKLHIMDNRGEVWKTVLVLVPYLAASLVAVSRIMDARHHPFDVLSGAALGLGTAWISYRQYFPAISNPRAKGRAYSRRTWGVDAHDMGSVEPSSAVEYTSAYNLRNLEEGRTGSSESLESEGKSRKRMPGQSQQGGPRPFTDVGHVPHGHQSEIELITPQQRQGSFAEPPPPHRQTWTTDNSTHHDYKGSVDMGERARSADAMESPESVGRPLRIGTLSPASTGQKLDDRV